MPTLRKFPWLLLNVAVCGCWIFVPGLRMRGYRSECIANLNEGLLGIEMYGVDNDDSLPLARNWAPAVEGYLPSRATLRCPCLDDAGAFGHAYNESVSARKLSMIPFLENTPILFDSDDVSWSATADTTQLPKDARHGEKDAMAFLSGVRLVPRSRSAAGSLAR
jgi:hypothetical protein